LASQARRSVDAILLNQIILEEYLLNKNVVLDIKRMKKGKEDSKKTNRSKINKNISTAS